MLGDRQQDAGQGHEGGVAEGETRAAPEPRGPAAATGDDWARAATLAVLFTVPVSLLVCSAVSTRSPGLSRTVHLWLAAAPIDVVGGLTVLAALRRGCPAGRRLAAVGLDAAAARFPSICLGVALAWAVYPVAMAATSATAEAMERAGHVARGAALVEHLGAWHDPLLWGSAAAVALLLAPVTEEVLFRVVLYDGLRQTSAPLAAPLSSAAFAVVHGVPEQVPALFVVGLLLQWLRGHTASLWPGVALHAVFNLITLALATAGVQGI